jgi:UDP-N-acetylglucosamine 2-epimerase (non-hydrolysing)
MKKITCVVGTRPNFIKISQLNIELEKQFPGKFTFSIVHTGQHFDNEMSQVFFKQFNLPAPHFLNIQSKNTAIQIGETIAALAHYFNIEKPEAVIVVGDVNSTLAGALAAHKNKHFLYHLEAGLRSFDRSMPEEINREITDKLANKFFVTEPSGKEHLLDEQINEKDIYFVGNTMIDTLIAFDPLIEKSNFLTQYNLIPHKYALITFHRPANVDTYEKLNELTEIIETITRHQKTVFPLHPRTKNNLSKFNLYNKLTELENLIITPPLSYFDFQKGIKYAKYVVTDSGGIQEETTYRQIPCLTFRPNTERPITITIGTNTLIPNIKMLEENIEKIYLNQYKKGEIPPLWDGKATQRIVQFMYNDLYNF